LASDTAGPGANKTPVLAPPVAGRVDVPRVTAEDTAAPKIRQFRQEQLAIGVAL